MNKYVNVAGLILTLALVAGCATAPAQPAPTVPPAAAVPTSQPAAQPPQQAATTAPQAAPAAANEIFFARPQGNHGPALAYDLASGYQLFGLPDGLLSADGQHYFAVGAGSGQTALDSYSPADGRLLHSTALEGEWTLAFVTAHGREVVLSRQSADHTQAEILILDGATARETDRVKLDGNFEVDGLSPDGGALFLIEYLPAINPDHYQIRLFTVADNTLQPGALVDKRAPDEVMVGERWDTVSTPAGDWLLTLYLRPNQGEAFIHALSSRDRFSFCIDLPSNGDLQLQKFSALALSPSGNTLYVANAVTGQVAEVSLYDLAVGHVATFAPPKAAIPEPQTQLARSVISKDGLTLYFTAGQDVWAYDTAARSVSGPFKTAGPITGLGLTADGSRLMVAGQDGLLAAFDTASGAVVSLR